MGQDTQDQFDGYPAVGLPSNLNSPPIPNEGNYIPNICGMTAGAELLHDQKPVANSNMPIDEAAYFNNPMVDFSKWWKDYATLQSDNAVKPNAAPAQA